MSHKSSIAFLGLGVMGYPMAGHLQQAGFDVVVYNRTQSKALDWVKEHGGRSAARPIDAVKSADIVISCVGNDNDIRDIMLGAEGVLVGVKPSTVIIDHTTTSADVAIELAAAFGEKSCGFIDAPVSGGQAGAENGRLTIMCGGDESIFKFIEPVISSYAVYIQYMGGSGAGQLTKMVNQICVAGLLQGLSEGLHFARSANLDVEKVVDVISKGAAQSWQMDNRSHSMLNGKYDHGFAVEWMRKDLAYALDESRNNGAHLPVTSLVDQFYSEVQALGGHRWDTSSLFARLEALKSIKQ